MTDQTTSLATIDQTRQVTHADTAFSGTGAFENAQRMAKLLSQSRMVPQNYQGNMPDALVALEIAQRTGSSPLMVMQNLHVIHGRPSWSSQFVIAALNSCGRFQPLQFRVEGEGDDRTCVAWTRDRHGNVLEGPPVSIAMAKAEGWYGKNGSKWQTMPELMLRYRAAKFFGNLYAPDILMGMQTQDEMIEIEGTATEAPPLAQPSAPTMVEPAAEDTAPEPAPTEPTEPAAHEPAPAEPEPQQPESPKTVPLMDADGQVVKEYQRGGDLLNALEGMLKDAAPGPDRQALIAANEATLQAMEGRSQKARDRVAEVRAVAAEAPPEPEAPAQEAPPMAEPGGDGDDDLF